MASNIPSTSAQPFSSSTFSFTAPYPPYSSAMPSASKSMPYLGPQVSPTFGSMSRGMSEERGLSASFSEDGSAWESAELRESMERARARALQARQAAR